MSFLDALKKFINGLGKSKFEKITKDDINEMRVKLADECSAQNDIR